MTAFATAQTVNISTSATSQTTEATILARTAPKETDSIITTSSISPPTTPIHISNFAHQLANHPVQQFASDLISYQLLL